MSEADTCRTYIVPKLHTAGWEDDSIAEQRVIAPGRIVPVGHGHTRQPSRRPDYLLYLKKHYPIAVVEAKADYKLPGDGLQQAMHYAAMLGLKFAYASNGAGIVEHDFITGLERNLSDFPTPDELWARLRGDLHLADARDAADALTAYFEEVGAKSPRYYQEIAINRAVEAVIRAQPRILLTMATGTGKTFVAFQIIWRLLKAKRKKRILYLADRNVLIDQAKDRTFSPLGQAVHKIQGEAVKSREVYFALYQALSGAGGAPPLYEQYPRDFFDLIVVDECHRGSASDESSWREILAYFAPAQQIGMTATPKRTDNVDTYSYFGEPIYTYSLKQGIEDGFLAPYRVLRVLLDVDTQGLQIAPGVLDRFGREIPPDLYGTKDFERLLSLLTRTETVARHLTDYLKATNRYDKTIVFCVDQEHALDMRQALVNANADLVKIHPDYVARVVSDEGKEGRMHLDNFQDPEIEAPVILTTSQMLTTGVDAPTCRNIVLFKPINSMTDFKQIIGRGTRVLEEKGKYWFTILDYVGATHLFYDPAFDGDPTVHVKQRVNEAGEITETQETPPSGAGDAEHETNGEYAQAHVVESESHERSKYYLDGVPVYLVGEQFFELDPDDENHILRTITFTDYVRGNVRRLWPNADHLLRAWPIGEQRQEITAMLLQHGIDLNELARITHHPDADPLDLLLNVAYNAPLLTRKERAAKLRRSRPNFFNAYQPQARAILNQLLDKYADYGLRELSDLGAALKVPPFDQYGTLNEIAALFGGPVQLKSAIDQMQVLIYQQE
ncbi:MAG: DEAD/DEAH box helicase family protein [Anaerolineae bacterium]